MYFLLYSLVYFPFFTFFVSTFAYLSSFPICEREGMTKLKRPCYFNLEDWHKRRSVILMEKKSWNFIVLSLSWTSGGFYMQEGILPRTSYWPCRNFMDFNVAWVVYRENCWRYMPSAQRMLQIQSLSDFQKLHLVLIMPLECGCLWSQWLFN